MTKKTAFHILVKPASSACNLNCTYCFYLEKQKLFANKKMSLELLEKFVKDYISSNPSDIVPFAWQGGEPTLMGLDFFKQAVLLQKKYAGDKLISNAIQTNASLLDDEFCAFLKENNFLVGISIDGPESIHNTFRKNSSTNGSYDDVIRGVRLCQKHAVEFNTLTSVNSSNVDKPLEVYRFLRELGSKFIQFIPIVERMPDDLSKELGLKFSTPINENNKLTSWSVDNKKYGDFLIKIFDKWVARDIGKVYVQFFDEVFSKYLGNQIGVCAYMKNCGLAAVLESNGKVYSCDHFVYPKYEIGDINNSSLADIMTSKAQQDFGINKSASLSASCKECMFLTLCNGDCPKHRFLKDEKGGFLSYLCPSYQSFYKHTHPYMSYMAYLYKNGIEPSYISEQIKKNPEFFTTK